MTAIDDVLRRVADLDAKATKGPWDGEFKEPDGRRMLTAGGVEWLDGQGIRADWLADFDRQDGDDDQNAADNEANAEFCAESRTLLPQLAEMVRVAVEGLRYHKQETGFTHCCACGLRWPCHEARTLSAIEAALKEGDAQ